MRKLIIFWLLFWIGGPVTAQTSLPEIKEVFELETILTEEGEARVQWRIAEDFFIFRSKIQIRSATEGIKLGAIDLPEPSIEEDDFFGPQEVYREKLTLDVPLRREADAPGQMELKVEFQGCRAMDECYPPHSQTFSLELPAVAGDESTEEAPKLPVETETRTEPEAQPISNQPPARTQAETYGEDQFLDPEIAFEFSAGHPAPDVLVAEWNIADGYYLYRDKLKFSLENAPDLLGEPRLPQGKIKDDPLFGRVEVYYDQLRVELPLGEPGDLANLVLVVEYQGCAEAGLCYPPTEKKRTFVVGDGQPRPADTPYSKPDLSSIQSVLGKQGASSRPFGMRDEDDFLPEHEAFRFSMYSDEPGWLVVNWEIADGYYLYRDKLEFSLANGRLGAAELPEGKMKDDPEFGRVEVYYYRLTARVPVLEVAGETSEVWVKYQGCAEAGLCYPPMEKSGRLALEPLSGEQAEQVASAPKPTAAPSRTPAEGMVSEQDSIAKSLAEDNLFWVLLTFFGFGLALSLTPCVFPMIPILSSIIVGQGEGLTTRRAFFMSLTYVLAMALTYTVAGVIAGLVGENLQAAFQNPWVLGSFAVVFVLLSLSMFGFYELQMPAGLQGRLTEISNRQQGGTLVGVAIMGFLSALIVGPCVAAPLAGALIYIGQTGNAVLGGLALFSLSLGMGVPLLVIGTSAGKILPRAGAWMDAVKYVFGVLLLAVAVWMLERIIDPRIAMLLWAALLILPAIYLGALDSLPENSSGWRKLWKGVGVFMLLYGSLLVVGAAVGHGNLFQPLKGLTLGGAAGERQQEGFFKQVKGLEGFQAALAEANARGKPVMLDFYADWCVSCKEMEHFTFSDAGVQKALENVVLLQADVTPNDELDKELYKHFGIHGPPAIMFFNPRGEELRGYRVVGFKPAEEFREHVEQALGG